MEIPGYRDFFGLRKPPFNLTPDPECLYLSQKHREALAGLTYAVMERKGFVVLTGDAGTGKTTLINSVLSRLPAGRVECSFLLNPTLTAPEFLEIVMLDFDIPDVPGNKAQRLWKFQEFLARVHHQNRYAVLVIDEAHKLSLELLEEVRLLGNYESASEKFLQILLLGQPELDDLLNRRDLRQLKQRIALRLYIDPLIPSEVHQYIQVRWAAAGAQAAAPFSPDAVARIAHWSQGIPRLINSLCDSALLMAYGDESPLVGSNYVRDAASNLGLIESLPQSPGASSPPLSAFSPAATVSTTEKHQDSPKPVPVELHHQPSETLPGKHAPTGPREEVRADKPYRNEWQMAQVLFGRRQFEEAETILVPLAAEGRWEVQALLELVREALAATEEAEFYKRGVDKSLKLIQEMRFDQAADILRNLLSLFPGDPILERHLASAQRSGEKYRSIGQPTPASAAKKVAEPEDPAGPRKAEPAAAHLSTTPSLKPAPRRFPWAAVAVCSVLSLLTAGVIWDRSRGKAPLNAPVPARVSKKDAPAQAQVEPAPAPAAPNDAAPAEEPAAAPKKRQPIEPRQTLPPKALRTFNAANALARGNQAQPELQSASLPVPPAGQTGRLGPGSASIIPDLLQPIGAVPLRAPPSGPQPSTAAPATEPNVEAGNLRPATPISRGAPEMPAFARQHGLYGAVELKAAIDRQGVVTDVKVVNGNPVLAAAAKQAVLKWRYQPATRNGQPVESEVAVHVVFGAGK